MKKKKVSGQQIVSRAIALFLQEDFNGVVIEVDNEKFIIIRTDENNIVIKDDVPKMFEGQEIEEGMMIAMRQGEKVEKIENKYDNPEEKLDENKSNQL
jgi:hypothetical protein